MIGGEEEEEADDVEGKLGLHELCRGAFEPLRSAIQSELMLLPGCQLLYKEGTCASTGNILNKEEVLEHIILDMTGSPPASADDISLQRTLRRTKRLLARSNSVLLFRLVIMVLVACMLIFTTLLTWKFTRTFSARSINNLSIALRHQILLSSLNSIAFVLNQAYSSTLSLSLIHQQALHTIKNGTWTTFQDEVRDINWRVFESEQHLHSVAFLNPDGRAAVFTRGDHSDILYFVQNSTVGMNESWYSQSVKNSVDGHGVEPIIRRSAGPFEERFLVDLLAQQNVTWSMDIGRSSKQFVTSAAPVIDAQTKQFLGMSIVSTALKDVHHYLSTIDLLGGYLYFFRTNASGSGSASLVATSGTHPNDLHLYPEKALNVYVAEAAIYLESTYGNRWLLQNETHSMDVSLYGKLFYIDTMPLKNKFKFLNMTAVILVPRASIMGEMDARRKTVIKVSVVAAVVVLVIGFCFICFLTRRMSTEMQLRQELIRQFVAKHKAEQSSNYKTQFLANMSHEMRTPMAGIIGLLDLLACESLTPDQETSVAQIRRCATGLLALVNNVLDISTVEAGKMELELTQFNLLAELESLVDMFAAQSLGSNVDIILDLSDEIPPIVKGDAARVRQIFTNLLSNALKFTESGHILIRGWIDQSFLSLSRKSVGNSFQEAGDGAKVLGIRRSRSFMGTESYRETNKVALAFEIDDTGCGIPVTLQETVFDRFVQADSSTTRTHGGSGLGLYIVRSFVNMMGGSVEILSKPGPGTCLRFHLILEKATYAEGDNVRFCLERPPISLLEDGLSAFVACPTKNTEDETFPSLELLTQTHALVALPDSVSKSFTISWLQRRGLSVTSVNKWEDVVPTISRLCMQTGAEGMPLELRASHNASPELCRESPAAPFTLPSAGSSSCVSELSTRPVLALLDVALASSDLLAMCNASSKSGLDNVKGPGLHGHKAPKHLEFLVTAFQQIPIKHDVLVAWVTPPNTDPWLKETLQSLIPPSVMIKRPLHSSRLRRLLSLVAEACKQDQVQSETQTYTSFDPSTPWLTGVGSPYKGAGSAYTCWTSESDADQAVCYNMQKPLEERLPGNSTIKKKTVTALHSEIIGKNSSCNVSPVHTSSESVFQGRLLLGLSAQGGITSEDSPSTPESPTSGLITPECVHSMADGVQEVKRDDIHTKDLENEWKGPFIDLMQSKGTLWHMRMQPLFDQSTSTIVSTSESPSTTAPSSPPCSNGAVGLGSTVLYGIHILLVEDTPVLQRLVSMMLKKLGAEVTIVGDGLQAVEAVTRSSVKSLKDDESRSEETASKQKFDLILMDCAMPVMDGYGATKAIREMELNTGRHIPIVALTAHALASDEERCLSVGMDAYLTKPINYKELVSTVKKLVIKGDPHL